MAQGGKSPQEVGTIKCSRPLAFIMTLSEHDKTVADSFYEALVCRFMAQGGESPHKIGTILCIWLVSGFDLCQLQQFDYQGVSHAWHKGIRVEPKLC